VVYGGVESIRDERGGLPNEKQRLGRRQEAGSPREKNGKVEQDTNEAVPVVADLKRFDTEGALNGFTGDDRHALHASPRLDVHPQ
jgi:hypothetical protein